MLCNIDILIFLLLINYKINYLKTEACSITAFLNYPFYQWGQTHYVVEQVVLLT